MVAICGSFLQYIYILFILMNLFKLVILFGWNILNTLSADIDYVETTVGCAVYKTGGTCPSGMTCEPNCLSCTDHPFSCNTCK